MPLKSGEQSGQVPSPRSEEVIGLLRAVLGDDRRYRKFVKALASPRFDGLVQFWQSAILDTVQAQSGLTLPRRADELRELLPSLTDPPRLDASAVPTWICFDELGGKVVGEVYIPFNTPQYESVLREIQGSGADIIFHTLTGSDTVNFRRQYAAAGMKDDFTFWTVDDEEVVTSGLGPEVSAGGYVSFDYFMTIEQPNNKAFLERFREKFGGLTAQEITGRIADLAEQFLHEQTGEKKKEAVTHR